MTQQTQNVLIKLTVDGTPIEGSVALPVGRSGETVLLPALQGLTDAVVNVAVLGAEVAGEKVSCRKGCDACCRQMVPIAPVEVFGLAAYLDGQVPGVVAGVMERFDVAVERLEDLGLAEGLRRRHELSEGELKALDRAYFGAGVACPFLVDRACSIHAVRPLACREYLVTSPAENCAVPEEGRVRKLAVGAKLSRALLKGEKEWVPLVLAREYVAQQREKQIKDPRQAMLRVLRKL